MGWASQRGEKFTISFPRQSFFLSRDDFTDKVSHESAHVQIGYEADDSIPKHGKKFYFKYRKNRKKLFKNYDDFINPSEILPIKYEKIYGKIYPSVYEAEYNKEEEDD